MEECSKLPDDIFIHINYSERDSILPGSADPAASEVLHDEKMDDIQSTGWQVVIKHQLI